MTLAGPFGSVQKALRRGHVHSELLSEIDMRVVVTGSRHTRTVVKWLHGILTDRGYDTCAWLTNQNACLLADGFQFPFTDGVRGLTESMHRAGPSEVLIVENSGPDSYEMRAMNQRLVEPHAILLTNIRPDHGVFGDRRKTAQAIARSIPRNTRVFSGETNPTVTRILTRELARRDVTVTPVSVPDAHGAIPESQCAYVLNSFLHAFDDSGLGEHLDRYVNHLRPRWTEVSGTRIFNATDVTDTETLTHLYEWLFSQQPTTFQPVYAIANGHDARTAAFVRYFNDLARRGVIRQARFIGPDLAPAVRAAEFPVIRHEDTDASAVLRAVLSDDWPVIAVANAESPFLEEFGAAIQGRARAERQRFHTVASHASPIRLVDTIDGPEIVDHLGGGNADSNLVVIDHSGRVAEWIHEWEDAGRSGNLAIISISDGDPAAPPRDRPISVELVTEATDLDYVLLLVEEYLGEADGPPVVWYDSINTLLGSVDLSSGLEFLRILAGQILDAEGVGYFQIDRSTLDERAMHRIERVFGLVMDDDRSSVR